MLCDEPIAQLALEHLADRAARQLVDEREARDRRCVLPTRALAQARSASASALAPARRTTKATGVSPHRSDGTPTTAASATAGMLAQHRLEVARVDVEAAEMIMSFLRSMQR